MDALSSFIHFARIFHDTKKTQSVRHSKQSLDDIFDILLQNNETDTIAQVLHEMVDVLIGTIRFDGYSTRRPIVKQFVEYFTSHYRSAGDLEETVWAGISKKFKRIKSTTFNEMNASLSEHSDNDTRDAYDHDNDTIAIAGEKQSMTFWQMPDDLQMYVFQMLSEKDLISVEQSCRALCLLARTPCALKHCDVIIKSQPDSRKLLSHRYSDIRSVKLERFTRDEQGRLFVAWGASIVNRIPPHIQKVELHETALKDACDRVLSCTHALLCNGGPKKTLIWKARRDDEEEEDEVADHVAIHSHLFIDRTRNGTRSYNVWKWFENLHTFVIEGDAFFAFLFIQSLLDASNAKFGVQTPILVDQLVIDLDYDDCFFGQMPMSYFQMMSMDRVASVAKLARKCHLKMTLDAEMMEPDDSHLLSQREIAFMMESLDEKYTNCIQKLSIRITFDGSISHFENDFIRFVILCDADKLWQNKRKSTCVQFEYDCRPRQNIDRDGTMQALKDFADRMQPAFNVEYWVKPARNNMGGSGHVTCTFVSWP